MLTCSQCNSEIDLGQIREIRSIVDLVKQKAYTSVVAICTDCLEEPTQTKMAEQLDISWRAGQVLNAKTKENYKINLPKL